MTKIVLLSDTHNYLPPNIFKYLTECDEIWHAGDIGAIDIMDKLAKIKPVRAVYGNVDGVDVRNVYPKYLRFVCDYVEVFMTHIGGKPGRYSLEAKQKIIRRSPKLFICGHSHILRVQYDAHFKMLYMNPGAAGMHGFHKVKTLLRFELHQGNIQNLEVVELGPRA